MTLLDDRNAAAQVGAAASLDSARDVPARLWQLLDGRCRFDVAAAPGGLDAPVRGVTIWDPCAPSRLAEGDLVLVIAPPGGRFGRLLAEAGRAGVAAVVLKAPEDPSAAAALATDAGVALLLAADDLCWDDIVQLAHALAPAARVATPRLTAALGSPWSGQLYDLAEAAADLLGGPVEITDTELRTLAFANLHHPVDRLRTESILARQAPPEAREWLATSGVLTRLRYRRRAQLVELPGGASPRAIAPLVTGDTVVGYLSLAEGRRRLTGADLAALTDVAAAVAARFVGAPGPVSTDDEVTGGLLRSVLSGHGSFAVLAARLGRPGGRWFLTCLGALGTADLPEPLPACYPGLLRAGAAATVSDGRLLVVAPHTSAADARLLAERLRTHYSARAGVDLVACISEDFVVPDDPAAIRRTLHRATAVLATAADSPPVATVAELRPRLVLAELAELGRGMDALRGGLLHLLRAHDAERGSRFLDTLVAFFDAGGDLTEAARRLHIHRNTLRYRLQRIDELCDGALEAPLERFTLELQIRLHTAGDHSDRERC